MGARPGAAALAAAALGVGAGRARRLWGPPAFGAVTLLVWGELSLWTAGGGAALRLMLTATCCLGSGWLAFTVLRRRLVLAGLLPLGVLFAVTLLNFPAGQGGYVLLFLLLTVSLLLALGWGGPAASSPRDRWRGGVDASGGCGPPCLGAGTDDIDQIRRYHGDQVADTGGRQTPGVDHLNWR